MSENYEFPTIGQTFLHLFLLALAVLTGLVIVFSIGLQHNPATFAILYFLVFTIPLVLWIIIIYQTKKGGIQKIRSIFTNFNGISFVYALVFLLSGLYIMDFIYDLIPDFKHQQSELTDILQPNLFFFLVSCLAAPILEEIIFRGIILDGLLKNYSKTKSLLVSSLAFSIIHLDFYYFIPIFLLGLFLGWIYLNFQSVIPCILLHAVVNILAFVFYSKTGEFNYNITHAIENPTLKLLLATVAAGLIYVTFLAIRTRQIKRIKK